jgi:Trp operon repressor
MNLDVQERSFQVFMKVLTSRYSSSDRSSFIELFLTPTEKIMFSKRVAISILIKRGYSYALIKDYLKVSQSTVAGIVKQLAISSTASQVVLDELIRDRDIQKTLSDFEYNLRSLIPPKGRDWSIWRKNLEHDKRLAEIPL